MTAIDMSYARCLAQCSGLRHASGYATVATFAMQSAWPSRRLPADSTECIAAALLTLPIIRASSLCPRADRHGSSTEAVLERDTPRLAAHVLAAVAGVPAGGQVGGRWMDG